MINVVLPLELINLKFRPFHKPWLIFLVLLHPWPTTDKKSRRIWIRPGIWSCLYLWTVKSNVSIVVNFLMVTLVTYFYCTLYYHLCFVFFNKIISGWMKLNGTNIDIVLLTTTITNYMCYEEVFLSGKVESVCVCFKTNIGNQ